MSKLLKYLTIILFWTTSQITICSSSKILAIFPIPFREHQIIYRPLIDSLLQRGHELVVLTTDPIVDPPDNLTQIDMSFTYDLKILDNLKDTSMSGSEMLKKVFEAMRQISDAELASEPTQNLLRDENVKFDAVICEWSGASVMNSFAHKYGAPLIGISSGGALINSHEAFGNPTHPIAYSNILLPFSEELNLLQRIASVVFTIWYRYLYYTKELPRQNILARKYFGDELPDLWDIESDADLLLINTYPMLGNVRPLGPTTVFLGGIHSNLVDVIPSDLSLFLETSVNGVVYVNLGNGGHTRACISRPHLEMLMYAVQKLNLDLIVNCDVSATIGSTINKTTRVYHAADIYQEDILAHGKTLIFITNGGQRNIEDAIHYEVPVLGISLSTYVEHYLRQVEKYNVGIVSFINYESNEKFTEQIHQTIENKKFKTNIEKLNRLVHDQPMSALDKAVWWIEYTIRNGGTNHLNSPMKNVSWFRYLLLDVLLSIIIFFTTIFILLVYSVKRLYKYSKSLPFEMVTRGSRKKIL